MQKTKTTHPLGGFFIAPTFIAIHIKQLKQQINNRHNYNNLLIVVSVFDPLFMLFDISAISKMHCEPLARWSEQH